MARLDLRNTAPVLDPTGKCPGFLLLLPGTGFRPDRRSLRRQALPGRAKPVGFILGDLAPIDFCGSVISLRIFDDRVTVKQVVLSGDWPRGLVAAWGYQLCRLLWECRCGRPVAPR